MPENNRFVEFFKRNSVNLTVFLNKNQAAEILQLRLAVPINRDSAQGDKVGNTHPRSCRLSIDNRLSLGDKLIVDDWVKIASLLRNDPRTTLGSGQARGRVGMSNIEFRMMK